MANEFLKAFGVSRDDASAIRQLAMMLDIPRSQLLYYNDSNVLPTGSDMEAIESNSAITEDLLKLRMKILDSDLLSRLSNSAGKVLEVLSNPKADSKRNSESEMKPVFTTEFGRLYRSDCIAFMKRMESDSIDMVFADPPFNLNKLYPSRINDNLKTEHYLDWCEEWIDQGIRILKQGGSLLIWNLPRWNASLAKHIDDRMTFKHWIAVDIKYRLPIRGRLYPSHYSLLYFVKGKIPNTFKPDRLPMQICPKCYGDLRDYGGYKAKMNPEGVNLSDIWVDIPPVRHQKYKRRDGANELSLKLMDRIIEMTTEPGDTVFDPFGGAGTTYMAAELKGRRWLGCEIGPEEDIVSRFSRIEEEREYLSKIRADLNSLFPEETRRKRIERDLWTCESVRENEVSKGVQEDLFDDDERH